MRKLRAAIVALVVWLSLAAVAVHADPYVDNALIDELFAELAVADSEIDAAKISQQIWLEWFSPNDPELAAHMASATAALAEGHIDSGLDELDLVVGTYPDYAEGWNQRATLYFRLGRYEDSLADVERVLAIEPRHFGAMSGRVLILLAQHKDLEALRQMRRALAVHPFLSERRLFPALARTVTQI